LDLMSTLPFPFCCLYNPKFQASQLLCLPTVFTLVHCTAYSTLKMKAICSSELSVDFNRLHSTLPNHRCENLKSYPLCLVLSFLPLLILSFSTHFLSFELSRYIFHRFLAISVLFSSQPFFCSFRLTLILQTLDYESNECGFLKCAIPETFRTTWNHKNTPVYAAPPEYEP
jgi:hypothetical protein